MLWHLILNNVCAPCLCVCGIDGWKVSSQDIYWSGGISGGGGGDGDDDDGDMALMRYVIFSRLWAGRFLFFAGLFAVPSSRYEFLYF